MMITMSAETYGYFLDQLGMSFDWPIQGIHSLDFWADMHGYRIW